MIGLQTIITPRSKLTVIERLPFEIKRLYYLHGIDPNVPRAGHAHKDLYRLLIAINGNFRVKVDGVEMLMNDPTQGLFVDPLSWLEFTEFSHDAVVLVVASREHDESDCIRDYEELIKLRRKHG